MKCSITWVDGGKEPQCAPNPEFPNGRDVDMSDHRLSCLANLPYPARRIGHYIVECLVCGIRVGVTTAGRPDDPRSVRVPCKIEHVA